MMYFEKSMFVCTIEGVSSESTSSCPNLIMSSSTGKDVVSYNGPTPPIGRHRYIFLLYEQAYQIEVQPPAQRNRFKARMFAQEHELGDPVAASLFYASAAEAEQEEGETEIE